MKTMPIAGLVIMCAVIAHSQDDCPSGVSRDLSAGTYKWYWDGQLNGAQFKNQYPGAPLSENQARSIVRAAIWHAISQWTSATDGTIAFQEGQPTDSPLLRIVFIELGSTEWGQSPFGSFYIYINQNKVWTDQTGLVVPIHYYDDIYTVMLHEMGHVFGASHPASTSSSVMYYSNLQVKRGLTPCDINKTRDAYNPEYTITLRNDFGSGVVNVYNKYDIVHQYASGDYFTARESTWPWRLEAVDQTNPATGFMMRFNSWTDGTNPPVSNRMISIAKVTCEYTANFAKEFNVTFRNSFVGAGNGGVIKVKGAQYCSPTQQFPVLQTDSIIAEAVYQVVNGIEYTFSHWSDGSTSPTHTFKPSSNDTYTASFAGKPRSIWYYNLHSNPNLRGVRELLKYGMRLGL